MSVYLFSLIGIGLAGRLARKENTLADFYLAGRGMGVFVLFLTLYATQYSGNTMIGFAGKAYRGGYQSLVMVIFMSSVPTKDVASQVLESSKPTYLARLTEHRVPTLYPPSHREYLRNPEIGSPWNS